MEWKYFVRLLSSRFQPKWLTIQANEPVSDQQSDEGALITKTIDQCKRYAYDTTKLTKKFSILLMVNPPWRTKLENAFSWIGGLRPSIILQLFDAALRRGLLTDESDVDTFLERGNTCFQWQENYNSYFLSVLKVCQDLEEKMETRLKDCQINPNLCPTQRRCFFFQHPRESTEEWNHFPTVLALFDGTIEKRVAAIKALNRKINRLHAIAEDAFHLRFQMIEAIDRVSITHQQQVGTFVKLLHVVEKAFRRKGLRLLWPNNYRIQERERNNTRDYDQDPGHHSSQPIECQEKPNYTNATNYANATTSVPVIPSTSIYNNDSRSSNNNNMTATTTIPGFVNAATSVPIMPVYPSVNLQIPNTNNFLFPSSISAAAVHRGQK